MKFLIVMWNAADTESNLFIITELKMPQVFYFYKIAFNVFSEELKDPVFDLIKGT